MLQVSFVFLMSEIPKKKKKQGREGKKITERKALVSEIRLLCERE